MIGPVCSKGFLHLWLILSILLSVIAAPLFQPAPVLATEPYAPTNLSPTGSTATLTPTLQASDFSDPDDGDIQTRSEWEISKSPSFSDAAAYSRTEAPFNAVGPIGSLEYSTTYYWRVKYCDNATECSAWTDASFTTPPTPAVSPSVSTAGAAGVTATSATLNGTLTGLGTAASVSVSFEWGPTASYGSETTAETRTGEGAFSASLTGLTAETTYHFRAKAVGDGTVYGTGLTFATGAIPVAPPSVSTASATGLTTTSATLNGNLTSKGTAGTVSVSFEWGPTASYGSETTAETRTETGGFSASLTGLTPGATYHFRAKAAGDDTVYGGDAAFTTATTPPSVSTASATGMTATLATLNGTLTGMGTAAIVTVSFEWGTTTSYGSVVTVGTRSGEGAFSASLNGLAAETTYHFRARAVGDGTVYGNDLTFTTGAIPVAPPSVSTGGATGMTTTSATLNGNLTGMGTASSVSVSFEWGTTASYGSETTAETRTATGGFSASLTGLAAETTYHFRAKAVGDGTVHGNDLTFATGAIPVAPPSVSTAGATSMTTTSATLNGNLTSRGTAAIVTVSFEWGTTASYGSETTAEIRSGEGAFSASLTGLTAETTYHFRARATGDGTAYGDNLMFTTGAIPAAPPVVRTDAAGGIGPSAATLNLTLGDLGTAGTVSVNFEWGLTSDYGSATTAGIMNGTGAFSFRLSNLTPATTYHFRARATGDGTAYGDDLIFTTGALPDTPPEVSTGAATGIGTTSATLNLSVANLGTAASVQVSFEWGLTTGYGSATTPEATSLTGPFSHALSDLAPATTYHFRARAEGDGTAYGNDLTFTTGAVPAAPPQVTTQPASGTGTMSATLNLRLTSLGTAAAVQVSFEWGPTADYGSATMSEAMDGTGILSFPISGLAPATIYHFRARAEGDGTAYGNDLTFTTSSIPAAPPEVTTGGAAVAASGSARLNGNLTSMGTAGSVMVSFVWGTTPGGPYPNETHGAIRTGNGTFYFDLSGLAPGTTCYFQARAVGDGTVYGEEKSFTAANGAPRIDSLLVISGRQGQDLMVKITGVNLGSATEVDFGDGVTVIEFSVVSDNEITARIAVGSGPQPETRDVAVTTSGGTASYPIPSGFLMSPADGSSGAGTGTKVHLWIYLAAVAGGLAGLSVVASLLWRWRAAKQASRH